MLDPRYNLRSSRAICAPRTWPPRPASPRRRCSQPGDVLHAPPCRPHDLSTHRRAVTCHRRSSTGRPRRASPPARCSAWGQPPPLAFFPHSPLLPHQVREQYSVGVYSFLTQLILAQTRCRPRTPARNRRRRRHRPSPLRHPSTRGLRAGPRSKSDRYQYLPRAVNSTSDSSMSV